MFWVFLGGDGGGVFFFFHFFLYGGRVSIRRVTDAPNPRVPQSLLARTVFLMRNVDMCAMTSKLSHCSLHFYCCAHHGTKPDGSSSVQDFS